MATYYIDLSATSNGDGTEGTPYNALASLPTLSAGDIVKLKRGSSQKMSAKYTVSGSGTVAAWIVFEDYGTGELPTLEAVNDTSGCIDVVGRSYVLIKNIKFVGQPTSLNQNSYGVLFNGGGAYNYIDGCVFEYLGIGINLSGGFSKTNVKISNTQCSYCNADGIRFWSGSGTYVWDTIDFLNCTLSFNGRAGGANGNGLNGFIQSGHTGTQFRNITVKNCLINNNGRDGIGFVNESVAWTTLIAAGNTTPPTTLFQGVLIEGCIVEKNKECGITIQGATFGTKVPLLINNNQVKYNSQLTTIGNIWTGGCIAGAIVHNVCIGAYTSGTVVGDGQGIFDDQWNDRMIVAFNYISSNIFRPPNPEYSAYGIGIYRATNSLHVGNVIQNCRYGYVIGTVEGSTAPVMANIIIEHNTFIDIEKIAFSIWTEVPSNSLTIRKNVILRAPRDVEAFTGLAGTQSWSQNFAYQVTTKYTGNNVGSSAWDHTKPLTDITKDGVPTTTGNLYRTGTYTGRLTNINGTFYNPPSIGAYEPYVARGVR